MYLNNLDYTKFANYTGISSIKAQDFFQYLYKDGYIYLKIITRCPRCKCDCTIDTELYDEMFECSECGEEFIWKNTIDFANFTYRINPDVLEEENKERISSPLEILSNSRTQHKDKVITIVDKIKEKEKMGMEDIDVNRKNKIFIVHGHDEATARRVKEFIKDDLNM